MLTRRPLGIAGRKLLIVVSVFGGSMVVFGLSQLFALSFVALAVGGFADMISMNIRPTSPPRDPRRLAGPRQRGRDGLHQRLERARRLRVGRRGRSVGAVPAVVVGGTLTILAALLWPRLSPRWPGSTGSNTSRGGRNLTREAATLGSRGAIAQLGERLDRTQEVAGSSPASSIDRTVYAASYFQTCAIANRACRTRARRSCGTHRPSGMADLCSSRGTSAVTNTGCSSDNPQVQIREAFRSVGRTLAEVGATWADVVEMTSYHVGLQVQKEAILRVHRDFIREPPYPAWTATGVTELFSPNAVFELSVVAVLPERAG